MLVQHLQLLLQRPQLRGGQDMLHELAMMAENARVGITPGAPPGGEGGLNSVSTSACVQGVLGEGEEGSGGEEEAAGWGGGPISLKSHAHGEGREGSERGKGCFGTWRAASRLRFLASNSSISALARACSSGLSTFTGSSTKSSTTCSHTHQE